MNAYANYTGRTYPHARDLTTTGEDMADANRYRNKIMERNREQ